MATKTYRQETAIDDFIKTLPDEEMDRLLEARHDEIEALLAEGRAAIERGEVAPLPPLHDFLREARERFEAGE